MLSQSAHHQHCPIKFYDNGRLVEEKTEYSKLLYFLYTNRFGCAARRLMTTHSVSALYGWMQTLSISRHKIDSFIKKHHIKRDDFEEPAGGYASFNDFFTRPLKPGARYVDQGPSSMVSPADAKVFVFPRVNPEMTFFIKAMPFDLTSFLMDTEHADRYKGGSLVICRLAPYDYHRFHAPFSGIPGNVVSIVGNYESVNPLVYMTGLQPLQTNFRQWLTLETEDYGIVTIIAVGAMLVGSITMTYKPGVPLKKGDELGFFSFGGSTVVLLFEPGKIILGNELIEHSLQGYETAKMMGQPIGLCTIQECHALPVLSSAC